MRSIALLVVALLPVFPAKAQENSADVNQFAELEERIRGRIGVTAIDFAGNKRVEYRAQERFLMCSTFKVLAVAAVLKRVDENKEKLYRFVPYCEGQLLEYAPVTRAHVKEGGMKVEALCAAAISQSDNTAANLLLEIIGGPKGFTEFVRSLGDEYTRLDRMEPELNLATSGEERDTTTPGAMCKSLHHLLTSDVLSASSRSCIVAWMVGNETGAKMIRASIPANWGIGDKTGRNGKGAVNDIAFIRPSNSERPFFLAIYVDAADELSDGRDAVVAEAAKIAIELLRK